MTWSRSQRLVAVYLAPELRSDFKSILLSTSLHNFSFKSKYCNMHNDDMDATFCLFSLRRNYIVIYKTILFPLNDQ